MLEVVSLMTEYVPTTEEVRRCYGDIHCSDLNAGSLESHECPEEAEFDRWLAEHDRQVKADAWDEGRNAEPVQCDDHETYCSEYECFCDVYVNPYREGSET